MSEKSKLLAGTPAPKPQPSSGSLINMPSHHEVERWTRDEKPKLIADIRKAWKQIATKARDLNGAIRLYDTSSN